MWSQMDQNDDVSRCSVYAILPHQTILFRGGYVDGANSSSDDAAIYSIVSMIVFSSTTTCLRSKLKTMGVHLRVATQNKHVGTVAESVQSDLDVMKLVNNDKEQVRVEVQKRN